MRWRLIAAGVVAASTARADIGIHVGGEPALVPQVSGQLARWLTAHGYASTETPLSIDAVWSIEDCFVLDDLACAHDVVKKRTTVSVVVALVQPTSVAVYWFPRDGSAVVERQSCECGDSAALQRATDTAIAAIAKALPQPPSIARVAPSPPPSPSPSVAAPSPPSAERRWRLGISIGVVVPRAELEPGLFLGGSAALALDRDAVWLAGIGFDWAGVGHRGETQLMPPAFPRSAGELDERLGLFTLSLGARVRFARVGDVAIRVGAAAGIQLATARFEVYGSERVERGIGPAATLEVEATGRLGAARWQATAGWRESRFDADAGGEDVTSGGLIAIGAAW